MKKKMASLALVMAMLVSALPAASAAEPVSKYAGKTITCAVYDADGDGTASRVIEVAVPEGATDREVQELADAAVIGADPMPLSADSVMTNTISMEYDIVINGSWATEVGRGTTSDEVNSLYVSFNKIQPTMGNASQVYVTVKNEDTNKTSTRSFSLGGANTFAYFSYSQTQFKLNAGDSVVATAKTNAGEAEAEYCHIFGYISDFKD